jgi:hypothetical protein
MNLLKKLGLLGASAKSGGAHLYSFAVQCDRCGEVIQAQINLNNDPSVEYDEAGKVTAYVCRKVLMGKQRCFQPIEVTLQFDSRHRLVDRKVANGKFVEG